MVESGQSVDQIAQAVHRPPPFLSFQIDRLWTAIRSARNHSLKNPNRSVFI
jgi:hypothetical protein